MLVAACVCDVGAGEASVCEFFGQADFFDTVAGVLFGEVLDLGVAAFANGHEEIFVMCAAGENEYDVVAVEFFDGFGFWVDGRILFAVWFGSGVWLLMFCAGVVREGGRWNEVVFGSVYL